MYFVLHYEYVENMLERRKPYRAEHLALLNGYAERGELLLGGAFVDPGDSSICVFQVPDKSVIEGFVSSDPYVLNGLIVNWYIREWNVVVGSTLQQD